MRLYEIELRRHRRELVAAEPEIRSALTAPGRVIAALHALLAGQMTELFVVMLLDNALKLLGFEVVARGGRNLVHIEPADVFRSAVVAGARAVVIAHCHPSGDASPSDEDIALTLRLVQAGEVLGISVLDHIVIAGNDAVSFKGCGLI